MPDKDSHINPLRVFRLKPSNLDSSVNILAPPHTKAGLIRFSLSLTLLSSVFVVNASCRIVCAQEATIRKNLA